MIKRRITALMLSLIMILSVTTSIDALESLERIKGKNNYELAAKIAEKKSYSTVVLVNMDKTVADGLSAASLAGKRNGVILLTSKNTIPQETRKKLEGIKNIYLIGNENAISKSIEEQLVNDGKEVIRLGGSNRYETSYTVAKEVMGKNETVNEVFIANGATGEADIVSAAPISYKKSAPILLTNGKKMNDDIKEIANSALKRYIIGGTTAIPNSIINQIEPSERIGGENRYATNKLIIDKFYTNPKEFYIVDKMDYRVASIACSICTNKPLVLVNQNIQPTVLKNADKIIVLGNVPENSVAMAVGYSGGLKKFKYNWTSNRLIAHAMGGIDNKDYTNSREAMEYNYKRGFRVFEVDLALSSDNKLIAWHSFSKESLKKLGVSTKYSTKEPTLEEFKKIKIHKKYSTLTFKDIVDYMEDHRDMYLIIDSKYSKDKNIKIIYEKILQEASYDVLSRIIPQAYNEVTYKRIMDVHKFDSIILTCYTMNKINEDKLTNLCATNGVNVITINQSLFTPSLAKKCKEKGIKLYMNTYNSQNLVNKYKKLGAYGFYTDFLTP